MADIARQDIMVKLGDNVTIPMVVSANLTDASLQFRVWIEGADADTIAPYPLTILDAPTGRVEIPFGPAQLGALTARGPKYWYDIQIVNGATIIQGRLFVEPDRVR